MKYVLVYKGLPKQVLQGTQEELNGKSCTIEDWFLPNAFLPHGVVQCKFKTHTAILSPATFGMKIIKASKLEKHLAKTDKPIVRYVDGKVDTRLDAILGTADKFGSPALTPVGMSAVAEELNSISVLVAETRVVSNHLAEVTAELDASRARLRLLLD